MKNYTKTVVAAVVLFAVSAVGFGVAFGYGGGSSSGSSRRTYPVLPPTANPRAVVATQKGRVLGASTFTTNLRQGMRGDAVKELQEALRAEGFFTYPTSTGYFGPITATALRAYQAAHGEDATGEVLGASSYVFTTNLGLGSTGDAVKELQERLRAGKYFTYHTSTGYFGPVTSASLKIYQAENGLPQTGLLDAATIAKLNQ